LRWAEEWAASIRTTSRERLNSGPFWDHRESSTRPSPFMNKMTDDQIAIVAPSAHDRLLEIGPGSGRLTLPLARSSSSITSVDPSSLMLRSLEDRARAEGLSNLVLVNDYWEHIDLEVMGRFHKAVSSFSLFMLDIKEQVRRMSSVADQVYLFVPADIRIPTDVQEIMFGRIEVEYTDHEILSNLTRDMGLEPVSFVLEYPEAPCFDGPEAAIEHCLDLYGASEEKRGPVAEHLRLAISRRDSRFLTAGPRKVGVIWWRNS
jgi:hypothetical protein